MKLTYNDVQMEMVEIQSYTRENVYSQDGVDLLYVKHRLTAMLTVGPGGRPAAISRHKQQKSNADYTFPDTVKDNAQRGNIRSNAGADILPTDNPFTSEAAVLGAGADRSSQPHGFMTDHELRLRLMVPRKRLLITAYDSASGQERVWVKAPRSAPREDRSAELERDRSVLAPRAGRLDSSTPRMMPHSDAANGPTPLRCDVVGAVGEGVTAGVLYTIEFNLVPVSAEVEKLILSHRWEISHQSDEDYYLTRVTTGIVVANGELLRGFDVPLSWFQQEFFHPIPLGFIRSAPEIKLSPDGLTMMYTIRDRDPTCMFDPGDSGATHLDIQETVSVLTPDPQAALLAAARLGPIGAAAIGAFKLGSWVGERINRNLLGAP